MKIFSKMRVLFIFSLFFWGCGHSEEESIDYDQMAKTIMAKHKGPIGYEEISNALTAVAGRKLKKDKNLHPMGFGGQGNIVLSLDFCYYQVVDMKEARELLVYAVNEFLKIINNNEDVKPYLYNCPFTAQNISTAIYFYLPNRGDVAPEKLTIIASDEGKVKFYNRGPDGRLFVFHRETFDEAEQIIKNESHSPVQ